MSSTCFFFFFVDFLVGKVFLSFKETKMRFGLIFTNTQFYIKNHNFLSECWIELKFYQKFVWIYFTNTQFYTNKHNFLSECWIEMKFY